MQRDWPQRLREQLAELPDHPGVYLMKDTSGTVLYVGKATSLKQRVRSYFQPGTKHGPKNESLLMRVEQLETVLVNNAAEALILESNLIKQYHPKYNIRLRDSKHYPYLKVTIDEEYPRLLMVRQMRRDGGLYFGPFTNSGRMYQTMKLLKSVYPLRSCPERQFAANKRPCLNRQIGLCCGPCTGQVAKSEYRQLVDGVVSFLQGKSDVLLRRLQQQMKEASETLRFEDAARLRDQIEAVKEISRQQQLEKGNEDDRDLMALACAAEKAVIQLFFVRGGKVIGQKHMFLERLEGSTEEEICYEFLSQFYGSQDFIPPEVVLNVLPQEQAELETIFSERRGAKVRMTKPQRGDKKRLLDLAVTNARLLLDQQQTKEKKQREGVKALEELRQVLQLPQSPHRIEGYDISHIQGTYTVASMVVFEGGKAAKKEYRRFRIRHTQGIDDFLSMQEVLRRRFTRFLEERQAALEGDEASFSTLPDLLLIDGGKGQLSAVCTVLEEMQMTQVPVVSLAKREEEVFIPGQSDPITLPLGSAGLSLLQQVRDEAHRFAITYNRNLRRQGQIASDLDAISGLGPKRKAELLKAFGDVAAIRNADVYALAAVPSMNHKAAQNVYQFFHTKEQSNDN